MGAHLILSYLSVYHYGFILFLEFFSASSLGAPSVVLCVSWHISLCCVVKMGGCGVKYVN